MTFQHLPMIGVDPFYPLLCSASTLATADVRMLKMKGGSATA
jgi:hypothetical protein